MYKTEFIRYLGVGFSNTVLTLAVYWAMLLFASHQLAYFTAFLVGVVYTGFLNSRFTFRVISANRTIFAYGIFYVLLFFMNALLLEFLVVKIRLDKTVAIFGVIAVGVPIGFAGSRFIFKR